MKKPADLHVDGKSARSKSEHAATRNGDQIFRCWVEVRQIESGSVRILPLRAVRKIYLPRRKSDVHKADEDVLQLEDGATPLEAVSLEDLATQLREKYPDGAYERTLHRERDREAEERRSSALDGLGQLIIESFVKTIPSETAQGLARRLKTKAGQKEFAECWPIIVDAYFHALCNPKKR